ncbi:MAG: leucyl/phenylalanyl-tRNA--protein transferase [Nitrospiraceae bacterium]|nr:MAG: leucyl/phenylalanyl-tRNA--protein transferase [Nitrospiraceae bacterium]
MPVFRLPDEHIFPPPRLAEDNGLLAVGGDLSESRLLLAYSMGIFPWYAEGDPILWWSPDPRLVLFPDELKISRSLRQTITKNTFRITLDTAFEEVIGACAAIHRKKAGGTWITDEMFEAYICLHKSGYAHSVEAWVDEKLAGGLYGISMGSAFFGESMFTIISNASKVAFISLVHQLIKWNFTLIDCQLTTPHLLSLGAREVPRINFLSMLRSALKNPAKKGTWTMDNQ